MKKYIVYISTLLLMLTCNMSAETSSHPKVLQVEVLIFSGRENPVFTITDPAEIQEITALANQLPQPAAASESAEEVPQLGFRGISVENLSTISPEVESFVVNRAQVRLNRKVTTTMKSAQSDGAATTSTVVTKERRVDGAMALHNRLLNMAQNRGVIDAKMRSHIDSTR